MIKYVIQRKKADVEVESEIFAFGVRYQAWKDKEREIYLRHQAQSSKDETKQ